MTNNINIMHNTIPFLDYYLNFARNDLTIKKIIEEEDNKLFFHTKNCKCKPVLDIDYNAIFNYDNEIMVYFERVKYDNYIEICDKHYAQKK